MIRREREARGWTLDDLAQATGIAAPNLSRIENTGRIRGSTLVAITDALGVDIAFVPRRTVVTLDAALRNAALGRERMRRAGVRASDPHQRLSRKAERGLSVDVEREALGRR
jgi:transcriptional regulator with XRE-family HTH domain